ncbi:BLUF domain-containing protein [Cribrihabitans neustonicus]|uniref:BLUF domain-containing protein n=1 Tax=Cribrihabitans neustonicus TaxID=1429085 RepID=UPI003B5BA56F
MHRFVIAIQSASPLRPLEIGKLIAATRPRARACGVTGMMTGGGACYYQVLEGPQDVLTGMLEQLHADGRFASVRVISSRPAKARAFDMLNVVYANPAYLAPAVRTSFAVLAGAGSEAQQAQAAEAFVATHAQAAA